MSYQPWQPTEGNEGAIARREMMLPPDLQMQGHMQALRDALLATMLLHEHNTPLDGEPGQMIEAYRQRQNERAKMQRRVKFLKERTTDETYEKCRAAAARLLTIEMAHQKQIQLAKYKPSTKISIDPDRYRSVFNRMRKEREAKSDSATESADGS